MRHSQTPDEAVENVTELLDTMTAVRGQNYRDSVAVVVGFYQILAVVSTLCHKARLTDDEALRAGEIPSRVAAAVTRKFIDAVGLDASTADIHRDAGLVFDRTLSGGPE